MWDNGTQPEILTSPCIKRLKEIEYFETELDAQMALSEFCFDNIGFVWEFFTSHKLFLFQELILRTWFKKDRNVLVAGRGASKSYMIAIFVILYLLLTPNAKVVLVANNFRRVKDIFKQIDKFLLSKGAEILSENFKDVSRAPDLITLDCNNGSSAIGLPLGAGSNIRGVRASCLIIDEGLLISETIQRTILEPFLTANQDIAYQAEIREKEQELIELGVMKEEEKTIFPRNKLVICSSASYQCEHLYKNIFLDYIKRAQEHKGDKNDATYSATRLSYEATPEGLLDLSVINAAKDACGYDDPTFMREYRALFTDNSGGFFNILMLKGGIVPDGESPTVLLKGRPDKKYILSIDPAYQADRSSDFFAMAVHEIDYEERSICQVHTFGMRGPGGRLGECYEYVIYLLTNFNIEFIIIDASGTEFIDGFNESVIAKDKSMNLKFFTTDLDNDEKYIEELKKTRDSWNIKERLMVYPQQFTRNVRNMNEYLQGRINAKKILFGSKIAGMPALYKNYLQMFTNRDKSDRLPFAFKDDYGNPISAQEFIDGQDDWIGKTIDQIALIQVAITSNGHMTFDLPPHLRKSRADENRARRDNYTCVLMAATASRYLFDMTELDNTPIQCSFTPFFL